jgi:hypothetical protein
MIAVSVDNLLFILLIAAAALFQLLSKTLSKAGKSDSDETSESTPPKVPSASSVRRVSKESDAERIRKFLEALGQPPSSTLPPPVAPRTDIPPRRLAPVQPPPVISRAWGLPGKQRRKPDITQTESPSSGQPRRIETFAPPPVRPPTMPAFEVHETLAVELEQPAVIKRPVGPQAAARAFGVSKPAGLKPDIVTLLVSKSGLREAILLREILGPPRGLQTLDQNL